MEQWIIPEPASASDVAALSQYSATVQQMLARRGMTTAAAAAQFFSPNYETDIHDPFLFRHMERAVERISRAIVNHEPILVHGDYDADGMCAATILYETLSRLGAQVSVFLPHREEDGYGINLRTVERAVTDGVKVLISCDCGIANAKEIAFAQEHGIDVIITDHHAMPEVLPEAYATIHPLVPGETYPWGGLAGGGVAFQLARALLTRLQPDDAVAQGKWLLDLVAISSIADMVPLLAETRALTTYGLRVLGKTKRRGLQSLLTRAGAMDPVTRALKRPLDSTTVGFQIAPRLNAAGRIEHPRIAFDLLTAKDATRADELATQLQTLNTTRQKITEEALQQARKQILDAHWENDAALVVAGDWAPGIVGLIAGNLMQEYWRPVFAVSTRGALVGSGRSIPGFHVVDAMRAGSDFFIKFGGHPQACGFTLQENAVDGFRAHLNTYAQNIFSGGVAPARTYLTEGEIALEAITVPFVEKISAFAPYGVGNPEPQFVLRGVTVRDITPVGEGKHARMRVAQHTGEERTVIAFGFGPRGRNADALRGIIAGSQIDLLATLSINEWNGRRDPQLGLVAARRLMV